MNDSHEPLPALRRGRALAVGVLCLASLAAGAQAPRGPAPGNGADSQRGGLPALREQVEENATAIDELESSSVQSAQAIRRNARSIEQLQQDLGDVRDTTEANRRAIRRNAADIGQLQQTVGEHTTRLDEVEAKAAQNMLDIASLQDAVTRDSDEIRALADLLQRPDLAASLPRELMQPLHCRADAASAQLILDGATYASVVGFLGSEGISTLSRFDVAFHATSPIPDLAALVGAAASLTLSPDGGPYTFSGIVTRIAYLGADGGGLLYTVTIQPRLALLTVGSDYRVRQGVSTPDLVTTILAEGDVSDVDDSGIVGSYEPSAMRVQYGESGFQFISRLLEQEGMHYFFREQGGSEQMVLGDDNTAFDSVAGSLGFFGHASPPVVPGHTVTTFRRASAMAAGLATVRGFDFRHPAQLIAGSASVPGPTAERYEFSQGVTDSVAAARLAGVDLGREQAQRHEHAGTSDAPSLRSGHVFALDDASAGGGSYLATRVQHVAVVRENEDCVAYGNAFRAIPDTVTFRPQRLTPKPDVRGIQTARVVGPAGAEVFTDAYGRVKVQFHWDRDASGDENSSAWLRVMLPPDRLGDLDLYLPRIGHEVVVGFEEGDPDRPFVLGTVYNGEHPPPVELPAGAN